MAKVQWRFGLLCIAVALCFLGLAARHAACAGGAAPSIEFNRDIRPIFADNCYACHGPDKNQRKADLRLDIQESALADRGGYQAIVPGHPQNSELIRRITSTDSDVRMPLPRFGKQLTPRQIDLIRRWIEQGAQWQDHWSRIAPTRPAVPSIHDDKWLRNEIDYFVLARLKQESLEPSPEADKRILARRLAFDLLGLPPRPEDVDAFLADNSPDAYEKLVDRLLASPHFGERMAMYWLDVVRYADTNGYHGDNHHDIALYRDYVINAFNRNKPFDVFTTEQLAGDLLPNATLEHKIASGYNRLLMVTREGGAQAKEYMAKYAADRVRNFSSAWLGATMGCAECHNHKFDPFLTKEFYRLEAFFADIKETAVGEQEPFLVPTPDQEAKLKLFDEQMAQLRRTLDTPAPELEAAQKDCEAGLRQHLLAEQTAWTVVPNVGYVRLAVTVMVKPSQPGKKNLPAEVAAAILAEPAQRTNAQQETFAKFYRTIAPLLEPKRKELAEVQKQKDAVQKIVPRTLITVAIPPRTIRVLPRGNWLDDSGDIVEPGAPGSLSPPKVEGRRANRLDLARWLTAPENPLVARVFVNRLWKLLFGQGLVKTLDDFGSQGASPTHPELLDWLAVEFRESGWDVKHMMKLIVMSATYRQSSAVSEALRQRDPYNYTLARQGRFRLDAETVRDNALVVCGLLSRRMLGPSVKPYQPPLYWSYLNFPQREWQADHGESLYRRSVYTYWCRTFLHPSMLAFDAPTREECCVERPRSNTPLQALVLLNDPEYVEAARAFAERILREGGSSTQERIDFAFRQTLNRKPERGEIDLLSALYERHLSQFRTDKKAAEELLHIGERAAPEALDIADLAAWTSVARVIFNLHETITRN